MRWRSIFWTVSILTFFVMACSSSGKKAVDDTSSAGDIHQADVTQPLDQRVAEQRSGDLPEEDAKVPDDAPVLCKVDISDCALECSSDEDCGEGSACHFSEDGCCSFCVEIEECFEDSDCDACETCMSPDCVPLPCPVECMVDEDCGPSEICVTNDGCCGSCQPADPCADPGCVKECDLDVDCGPGESCIWWGEGCCSECHPECEFCYIEAGTFCPQPDPPDGCEKGLLTVSDVGVCWFEVTYAGEDGIDTFLADGCVGYSVNLDNNGCGLTFDEFGGYFEVACNWCGTVEYAKGNCECLPDCTGKSCGDDGCGGSCGECDLGCFCNEAGQCAGCADELIELEPLCVHVPSVVQAGEAFAVAIYGQPGCSNFDHYEVDTNGTEYQITLYGTASPDPDCPPLTFCEAEQWSYIGLVWLNAPNPGPYTVKVGQNFIGVAGATGGIVGEPSCDDACASPTLENYDWTMNALTQDPLLAQCIEPGSDLYQNAPLTLTGACQDYVLEAVIDLPQIPATHCTDGHILFGSQAPYWMEATVCGTDPLIDGHDTIILGTIQGSLGSPLPAQLFMATGLPLWN